MIAAPLLGGSPSDLSSAPELGAVSIATLLHRSVRPQDRRDPPLSAGGCHASLSAPARPALRCAPPGPARPGRTTDAAGTLSLASFNSLGWRLSTTDPDLGSWSYSYDADGQVHSQTDARGQTITFGYDGLRRLISKSYSSGQTGVTYSYDGGSGCNTRGRRSGMIDGLGDTTYCYDARGNLVQQSRRIDGVRFGASFSYDARGKILTETAPDGEVVRTGYDEFGRESSLNGAATDVSSTAYNALDLPVSRVYGNGRTATATYYDAGTAEKNYRLQSLRLDQAGGGDLLHLTYAYDATGNLTQLGDATNGDTQSFADDFRDRLTLASGTSPGYSESYAYNATGNLTSKGGVS